MGYSMYYRVPLSYDLTPFQILGQKFSNFFVGSLVQTMTPKGHFEINWSLTEIVHRRTYIQWLWFYSNALSIQAWILRHKQVTGCDFFASKLAGTIKPRTSGASWSFERIGMIIQWTMECLFMANKFAISKWPCVKEIWFWLTKLDIF